MTITKPITMVEAEMRETIRRIENRIQRSFADDLQDAIPIQNIEEWLALKHYALRGVEADIMREALNNIKKSEGTNADAD